MTQPDVLIGAHLQRVLYNRPAIVLCGRQDDATAWQRLLGARQPDRYLTIALDEAARSQPSHRREMLVGATGHLAWQHDIIGGLDESGWLTQAVDTFDPDRKAILVLPDPLDPPAAGQRTRIGRRPSTWRLLEDKTTVDAVWDILAVPRAPAIVADLDTDLRMLGDLVDRGFGVVCSQQSVGTSSAGADGVSWWRTGETPRIATGLSNSTTRVRLMPLIEGLPTRLHGLVMPTSVVGFPAMEVVALPRTGHGTFLCAGVVSTLEDATDLIRLTERIGTALRSRFGYLGAFAVDGILTDSGFTPTDLNPRLTSAMEGSPPDLRVLLHAANLLVREGIDVGPDLIGSLSDQIFRRTTEHTIYGAATSARVGTARGTDVWWDGDVLVARNDGRSSGRLALAPSPRGWQLTARLSADQLPSRGPLGPNAVEVFRLCDQLWETDFGELAPPFGVRSYSIPAARGPTSSTTG